MEATAWSVGKAVLDGALGYAKSFVAEEIALQLGVERDVIFIADELEMMQSFLMTADEEQDKNKVLLTWVKQVRNTAYNVEDNLMDFALHTEKKPFCFFIPRNLWERRRITKEVKDLRAKVEDVSNRNLRYRLIKGSGSKATTNAEEQASLATIAMLGIDEETRTTMNLENSVIGLRQLVTNEDRDRTVLAVWGGTGDLRMTAIQEVYDDSDVRANFGFCAWAKLVRPFSPKEFIQSLMRQYYQNFPEEWDCIENFFPRNNKGNRVIVSTQYGEIARLCAEKPQQVSKLKQGSTNQSLYLIHKKVMPSPNSRAHKSSSNTVPTNENSMMSNGEIQDGNAVKVSDSTSTKKFDRNRTMALVGEVLLGRTTEESQVTQLVGQPEDNQGLKVISVWGMGGLGKTSLVQNVYKSPLLEGWKRAWATALRPFNPEQVIRKLATDLLGECAKRDNIKLKELTERLTTFLKMEKCLIVLDDILSTREWDLVKNSLKDAGRIIVTTREKSIAKHCSKEDKNLCNLQEDHRIRREQLIRRWIAEGYATEMHGMTAEVGDKYFEELLDRSMILPSEEVNIYSGKYDSCQLHDIMRQICISKAREENLAFTLEDRCSLSGTQGVIRHLAISTNWNRDRQDVFQRTVDLSHVRSLTVFGKWESIFISKKMSFLRVLDLDGTVGITEYHLNQIGELIHLKFLSLQRCLSLQNLPDSLCNLRNLQTLDVRGTNVQKLPPNCTNLRKLQFLCADNFRIPRGIGKLNALSTLCGVNLEAHEEGKGSIKELRPLYRLRRLVVDKVIETNREEFWSAICSLSSLRSLGVNWNSGGLFYQLDYSLGGSLFPPRSIESLKLRGQLVRLPEWIQQLQNLTRLQIRETRLQQDAMQAIGKLPSLAILCMGFESFMGEELIFQQGSFPSLVVMELDAIADVPFVMFEDGTMPKVELLRIGRWRYRHELSGLMYLTVLKEIQAFFLYSDEFKDSVLAVAELAKNSSWGGSAQ
ncbi:hypothetical protein HU200_033218 [Digitaria exilis]|uniref:Uncharacterized protein n=1 Tax=Digitaria exilis TaxID=1010633 RepID=A0A835BLP9_9POAL|nr:hypothetical protein HU200_033218 [Digitaria exilis]